LQTNYTTMEENLNYTTGSFYDSENTHDPIWGSIKISAFEMRLINTPEFQRLRRIKQLGFVNLVYPAAEHSRFVHSIGVCHHAKKLIYQINENFKRNKRYRVWRNLGINDDNIDITYETVKISAVEKIIISAAALLHDLPHSPFSHEIESPNGNPLTGIPNHDDFDKNPVFFKYLFDYNHSRLAEVIKLYNSEFWELLRADKVWFQRISEECKNWKATFTNDGYIIIGKESIIDTDKTEQFTSLPILGVMIFELHLFEKPEHWVDEQFKLAKPRKVKTGWNKENSNLDWQPIYGWFRPYRKDIVGNTICADLIDYIERDGRQTGIISSIDLKFLDRMTICKAIPEQNKATALKVTWEKIPKYCEHIVFDIYDHKRGFIRESVITEILSCLQARYQLTERVYNHRVVEGARSMLQEISRLLCSVEVLNIKLLHTSIPSEANCPTGDDTFLAWVMDIEQRIFENKDHPERESNIRAAAKLAEALKERRVYREAVIIDGIHGYTTGSLAGGESNCRSLEYVLLDDEPKIYDDRNELLSIISNELNSTYKATFEKEFKDYEPLATIGARKVGKKYKIPRVLVAKPYSNLSDSNLFIDIQPLFACEDPPHIKIQLDAMKTAYNSLWRVYLFIHPAFHWNKFNGEEPTYYNLHIEIEKKFLDFVNKHTPIHWKNSIDYKQLLPRVPVDYVEFIEHFVLKDSLKKDKTVNETNLAKENVKLQQIIDQLIEEVFAKLPEQKNTYSLLTGKQKSSFFSMIVGDEEMVEYVLNEKNKTNIVAKLPEKLRLEDRANLSIAKKIYGYIKKIMSEPDKLF